MNTKDGNRIIEQFMFPYDIIGQYRIDQLTYHSNWNELMKVVIEIEEISYEKHTRITNR